MTGSRAAELNASKPGNAREVVDDHEEASQIKMGELSELLGYSLKRAQLRIFDDFIRCVASLNLTPAQFSVLLLIDRNPGRNQTEIANTLGILRPNFVAMLDSLEGRELCVRVRSANDRRSHILMLTDNGRTIGSAVGTTGASTTSSATEVAASALTIRSLMRHSGSRMLHFAY
ncbi:MAG: MarR family transcriptional regulator [Rhizobiales bacterium]|nr:MarR family transcriptional regulator [Hyphomicrobiales bacterium]